MYYAMSEKNMEYHEELEHYKENKKNKNKIIRMLSAKREKFEDLIDRFYIMA